MKRLLAITLATSILISGEIFAGSRSNSSSGRSSFSSNSRSFSSGRSSYTNRPTTSVKQNSKPATSSGSKGFSSTGKSATPSGGKSFSSGSKPTPSSNNSKSFSSGGIKPGRSSFDSIGSKEQTKVESRQLYQKGQLPKTEYKTASGQTVKINPKDRQVERLRGQLDQQKWVNRELRQQQFYGAYYSRPVVVYNDPYPSFFWWWLLDRSAEERAMWAYHHRYDMDQARYQAMLAKDAQLEARIRHLETRNVTRDSTYVPKEMDPDLMYTNNYVDAVYNPNPTSQIGSNVIGIIVRVILWIMAICAVVAVVYFVFFYRGWR